MGNPKGRPKAEDSKALQRREEIKQLAEDIGFWNIPQKALAEKWGVNRNTITHDIAMVKKGIPKPDLEEIKINFLGAYKKAGREMQKILATGNNSEKAQASRALKDIEKGLNDLLESHGLKEKVADKLELKADFLSFEEALKKAKGRLNDQVVSKTV